MLPELRGSVESKKSEFHQIKKEILPGTPEFDLNRFEILVRRYWLAHASPGFRIWKRLTELALFSGYRDCVANGLGDQAKEIISLQKKEVSKNQL